MRKENEFQGFLQAEVEKYKGVAVPVNAGLLRQALIRYAPVTKLHPNPDDEFCFPDIGPNQGITRCSSFRPKRI